MQKKKPVVVNLIRTDKGFTVEEEKIDMVFRIPKSIAQQPVKVQYMPPPPPPQQPWYPPIPIQREPMPKILPPVEIPKRPIQKYQLIVPSCALWFKMDDINSIERQAFPDFFAQSKQSKTPELYKKYRNFMVTLYRQQPNVYLSNTACRKVLAGDACSIARIHGFLQHWGLINYSVDPETCPGKILPQPFINKTLYRQICVKDELDDQADLNAQEVNILNTIRLLSKKYRPICDFCNIQCGLMWFQQKTVKEGKELTLCVKCYTASNYPSILSADDFNRVDIEQVFKYTDIQEGQPTLTDEELVTVLQVIQDKPDATWDVIAQKLNDQHKTSHSEQQILLHFLQYPLKNLISIEKLLESKENLSILSVQDIAQRLAIEEPNIYSDSSNVISFHLAVFKRLLNKYNKKTENGDHQSVEESQVIQLKNETIERARVLQLREEAKLNEHINLLIHLQMEKLELKLNYLEEYEKLIMYEKSQLEQSQKFSIAERMTIIQQKLFMMQDQIN